VSEFQLGANKSAPFSPFADETGQMATPRYLNASWISVLSDSRVVYVSCLNQTTRSCPNYFTKMWPVAFEFLACRFIYKIKMHANDTSLLYLLYAITRRNT